MKNITFSKWKYIMHTGTSCWKTSDAQTLLLYAAIESSRSSGFGEEVLEVPFPVSRGTQTIVGVQIPNSTHAHLACTRKVFA